MLQVDGLTDMNAMKQVIAKLETELHEKSTNASYLEAEIRTLQRKLQMKDAEIAKQERELHKLRVRLFKYWHPSNQFGQSDQAKFRFHFQL